MIRMPMRCSALALAATLALAPASSDALLPVVAMFAKQMVQQALTSTIKEALLGSLRDQGCKGMALANALSSLDVRSAGLSGGMPKLPAGMTMPGGVGMAVPAGPGMPGLGALPAAGTMPADMAGMLGGLAPGGAAMPPGMSLTPEQAAMMAQVQTMMSQPLSPAETVATIDELAELGFLPKPVQTELKECMVFLPQTVAALGMSMGMLKPMVPQLRQARAQMHALPEAEQDELADTLAQELRDVPERDRKTFVDSLGGGFFPPRVGDGVKARLAK